MTKQSEGLVLMALPGNGRASIVLYKADEDAIAEIIASGYAHSFTTVVRFSLQRAVRFVRSQKAA